MPHERVLHSLRRRLLTGVRATRRFGDDLVDHAKLEEVGRGDAERARRALAHLRTLAVLPEDRRAALDSDHRIDRILEHVGAIGDAEGVASNSTLKFPFDPPTPY